MLTAVIFCGIASNANAGVTIRRVEIKPPPGAVITVEHASDGGCRIVIVLSPDGESEPPSPPLEPPSGDRRVEDALESIPGIARYDVIGAMLRVIPDTLQLAQDGKFTGGEEAASMILNDTAEVLGVRYSSLFPVIRQSLLGLVGVPPDRLPEEIGRLRSRIEALK